MENIHELFSHAVNQREADMGWMRATHSNYSEEEVVSLDELIQRYGAILIWLSLNICANIFIDIDLLHVFLTNGDKCEMFNNVLNAIDFDEARVNLVIDYHMSMYQNLFIKILVLLASTLWSIE